MGEKLAFLKSAADAGYNTILCYIGTASPAVSEQRVSMRVSQGGHDVPNSKLEERFPRILANLKSSLRELPNVWVFDNNDLRTPWRLVAIVQQGRVVRLQRPVPKWLAPLLPKTWHFKIVPVVSAVARPYATSPAEALVSVFSCACNDRS